MNGNWSESKIRTVKLDDVDPATFTRYLHLVSYNKLCTQSDNNDDWSELDRIADIYILAERLQDVDEKYIVPLVPRYSQDTLGRNYCDGLRGHHRGKHAPQYRRRLTDVPTEFLVDLMVALAENTKQAHTKKDITEFWESTNAEPDKAGNWESRRVA
ncbi:hypothetical protein M011DRAFT_473114 [Sporormia fimetaria CBS 119925]|uniref:BTB domain-containing protein n=1 Tax=Sporormia fimetaria CBS 119925 TaxID=1340428 RepID=A0A6A6VPT0_9PLEO|nr:hypothetical protein M011DRAFT_473114 [Sporormia fimetaria CBS 119925]